MEEDGVEDKVAMEEEGVEGKMARDEEMSEGMKEVKQLDDLIKAVHKYSAIGKDRLKQESHLPNKDQASLSS
jgi:hypothetical protein